MQINELFNKSDKTVSADGEADIILSGDLLMHRGLNRFATKNLSVKTASAPERLKAARQNFADAIFCSSIDLARIEQGWQVVPKLCLASAGKAPLAILSFDSAETDLSRIQRTVEEPTIEAALQIILREKYNVECTFFDKGDNEKVNCRLLIDDDALRYGRKSIKYIDIADEWLDLCGFPLVFGFWLIHESNHTLDTGLFETAHQKFFENAALGFGDIMPEKFRDFVQEAVCNKMIYVFDDDVKESLAEFYNYAFMYGLIEYIPKFDFRV